MPLAVDAAHEPAERHVDGCGEEGRRDEDEHGLHDVGGQLVGFVVGDGAGDVA